MVIDPLDEHSEFDFYVVNDCPAMADVVMPDQLVRVSDGLKIPLNRLFRNPADNVMMLWGTTVNWTGTACN